LRTEDSGARRFFDGEVAKGVGIGIVATALIFGAFKLATPWLDGPAPSPVAVAQPNTGAHAADFGGEYAAPDVRRLANWVAQTGDSSGMEFIIVDKKDATLYVFDSAAHLRASSRILIGAAVGDDTVPGIGSRPIPEVRPEERTTPAGRFVAERGHDTRGEDVIWVDYDNGVSMHRVITSNPAERRLERLSTPDTADKRISYGCINLPVAFYDEYVKPMFAERRAVVYVLPEVKPLDQVFAMNAKPVATF
jgi:hypothetical protein